MSTIHACYKPGTSVNSEIIDQMLMASEYWHPDANSRESSKYLNCRLAKASLYNAVLSEKDIVYKDSESGLIISANARLDNRDEIIHELMLEVNDFTKLTDSQIILKAYQQWGENCPAYLLGDFVFIIWDEQMQRLFCARDHFGIKVLFYSHGSDGFMVTNEHNAFFTTKWQAKNIKESWLISRLWGLGPQLFESPYQGIRVLPPAHSMVLDSSGIRTTCYWKLQEKNDWQGMDDEELLGELKRRFQQAVKKRLDSQYPLGAELSEGVDSNGIVGHAAKMLDGVPLYTFSYMCEQLTKENESVWGKTYRDISEMIEMHDNLNPVWSKNKESELYKEMSDFYQYFGGVLDINGGHFLRPRLAQEKGIRTLLSGWGGDHCVSSYGDFFEDELFSQGKLLSVHQLLKDKYQRGRGGMPLKAWLLLLLKHFLPYLHKKRLRKRGALEHAMHKRAKQHFLKKEYIIRYQCERKLESFTGQYQRYSTQEFTRRELFDVGVESRLVESELCGRIFQIEYRYPMLDVPLIEFAFNMPGHLKIHHGIERYMFRRVLEGITTKRIQWRQKADVNSPNRNHKDEITSLKKHITRELQDSNLVHLYCDKSKLGRHIESSELFMEIKNILLMINVEKQLKKLGGHLVND